MEFENTTELTAVAGLSGPFAQNGEGKRGGIGGMCDYNHHS